MTLSQPTLAMEGASLSLGGRTLWQDLDLRLASGEFIGIIGPNGSGKTSLLRAVLGLLPLDRGRVLVDGEPARRGHPSIGYVPQHRSFAPDLPLRGRDLVALGLNGHRYGFWGGRANEERRLVDEALAAVDALDYADESLGRLSGGQQQRLRIAEAIVGNPRLLLFDEPLASLDIQSVQSISAMIDRLRRERQISVMFVTHDVNPVLGAIDRVLCIARGRWAVGAPAEVLTRERLSSLYETPVEVLSRGNELFIVGADIGGHEHAAGEPRA